MPYLETPYELAEHLADLLGIYEDKRCDHEIVMGRKDVRFEDDDGHEPDCDCRVLWVPRMAERIRNSVANEARLFGNLGDSAPRADDDYSLTYCNICGQPKPLLALGASWEEWEGVRICQQCHDAYQGADETDPETGQRTNAAIDEIFRRRQQADIDEARKRL